MTTVEENIRNKYFKKDKTMMKNAFISLLLAGGITIAVKQYTPRTRYTPLVEEVGNAQVALDALKTAKSAQPNIETILNPEIKSLESKLSELKSNEAYQDYVLSLDKKSKLDSFMFGGFALVFTGIMAYCLSASQKNNKEKNRELRSMGVYT